MGEAGQDAGLAFEALGAGVFHQPRVEQLHRGALFEPAVRSPGQHDDVRQFPPVSGGGGGTCPSFAISFSEATH